MSNALTLDDAFNRRKLCSAVCRRHFEHSCAFSAAYQLIYLTRLALLPLLLPPAGSLSLHHAAGIASIYKAIYSTAVSALFHTNL